MELTMYVCPTEGCGNYYGSSSSPDLRNVVVARTDGNYTPRPVEQHHTRAQCPDCRARGVKVERVLVTLPVPESAIAVTPIAA